MSDQSGVSQDYQSTNGPVFCSNERKRTYTITIKLLAKLEVYNAIDK